ncbi:MAG: SLC13 family permease [Candidatus Omnitrophica bacterium]|nr:SLC13 family permease [Candidatus Omnitrophota bacterium]
MKVKFLLILLIPLCLFFLSQQFGLNLHQATSLSIFAVSILGTLLFWSFRLTFAFLGTAVLLMTKTIDLEHLILFSSLEVILFLIGMMVIVGLLKDTGFFAWLVSLVLRMRRLTANKFLLIISFVSAILSCLVGEVAAIIFILAVILEICDYFEVNPVPFVIIAVMAVNIGSVGTILGNPIGVLIAIKSGLTFEDFIIKAFPIMVLAIIVCTIIFKYWYRKALSQFDRHIKELGANEILIRLISISPCKELKISLGILLTTLFSISLHHRIEILLGLPENTVLLALPLVSSGLVMLWKSHKARDYIEKDVEWWTLLFFLLLFAQAGTLKYSGTTDVIASRLGQAIGNNASALTGIVLWVSTIGSSILDNVVLVAAFIPVLQSFSSLNIHLDSLWWALLIGGCFGGNITIVGSTANIVALGILEKEKNLRLKFLQWLGIGLVVGCVTVCIAWAVLIFVPYYH